MGWISTIGLPILSSILRRTSSSSFMTKVTAFPGAPALPVLPTLWTYTSGSTGMSKLTTMSTPSMSSPLEATSLAMSTSISPSANARRVFSLLFCSRSPWILPTEYPSRWSLRNRLSTLCFVRQKTIIFGKPSSMMRTSSSLLESRTVLTKYCAVASTVWSSRETRISLQFSMFLDENLRTSPLMVAENIIVCLLRGTLDKIRFTVGAKPMSSITSASSRTTISTSDSTTASLSRRSLSLPGVATMTSTPFFSSRTSFSMSVPPYTAKQVCPLYLDSFPSSSDTCQASSRVGTRTSAPGSWNPPFTRLRIIEPYVPVFPVPVCA